MPTVRMIAGFAAWFALITIGSRVDSSAIDPQAWYYGPLLVLSSTITNLALVAIAASVATADSRIAQGQPIHAAQRGFILYVASMGPAAVVFTQALLVEPSADQYGKLALSLSTICAIASRYPIMFDELTAKILDFVRGRK